MVEALAHKSQQDRDGVIEYFKSLWETAAKSPHDSSGINHDKVRLVTQTVREGIQHQSARPFADLMVGTLDEIEAAGARNTGLGIVPTGFSDTDALLGGMRPGQLIAIASAPSIGKSMLLTTICAKCRISTICVLLYSALR